AIQRISGLDGLVARGIGGGESGAIDGEDGGRRSQNRDGGGGLRTGGRTDRHLRVAGGGAGRHLEVHLPRRDGNQRRGPVLAGGVRDRDRRALPGSGQRTENRG